MHSRQVDVDERLAAELATVTSPAEIVAMTKQCGEVHVDDKLFDYINTLVRRTREWPQFYMGASPRAGLALVQGRGRWRRFTAATMPCPTTWCRSLCPHCGTA